jgi:hypothetical protein
MLDGGGPGQERRRSRRLGHLKAVTVTVTVTARRTPGLGRARRPAGDRVRPGQSQ